VGAVEHGALGELAGDGGFEPRGMPVVFLVEPGGIGGFAGGIDIVDGDDAAGEVHGDRERIEALEFRVAVHRAGDGILLGTDFIPIAGGGEGLVETEGLHVAVALEEVAINGVDDRLR